jgi:hypothetical protein
MKVDKESRRHPRLQCQGTVEVHPSGEVVPCPAKIMDLSVEGCLIKLQNPRSFNKEDLVELAFSVKQLPFRVRGQVKAIRSDTTIGFQFPALSQRVRRQLEDLVEELGEERLKHLAAFKKAPESQSRLP